MNDNVKIAAAILAAGLVVAVGIYVYFSPYNTCVRAYTSTGTTEKAANFICARQLGGSAQ